MSVCGTPVVPCETGMCGCVSSAGCRSASWAGRPKGERGLRCRCVCVCVCGGVWGLVDVPAMGARASTSPVSGATAAAAALNGVRVMIVVVGDQRLLGGDGRRFR